jgi:rhomboid protease GluP
MGGIVLAQPDKARAVSLRTRLFAGSIFSLSIAILIGQVPEPTYRWSEEVLVRKEIGEFLRDDAAIRDEWQSILDEGKRDDVSFNQLAGRIDMSVGDRYEESFEQLSQLPHNPALPSAVTVEMLRHYAERRRDASRAFAESLRIGEPAQIMDALEREKESRKMTRPDKAGGLKPRLEAQATEGEYSE